MVEKVGIGVGEKGRAKRPRKSEVIHVRVTTGERDALDRVAATRSQTMSGYLRCAGLHLAGAPGKIEAEAADVSAAVKSLTGAANNLNQLTRAANRGRISMGKTDRLMLLDLGEAVREAQAQFRNYLDAANRRAGELPEVSLPQKGQGNGAVPCAALDVAPHSAERAG